MINIFEQKVNWKTVAYDGDLLEKVNKIFASNLREICLEVFRTFPEITSVYVIRGYSRGEASVLVENGEPKFLSDHDLLVVSNAPQVILNSARRNFDEAKVSKRLCNIETMEDHPTIELILMNRRGSTNLPLALSSYEVETAKCIYGPDEIRALPQGRRSLIPPTEGFRLLCDRILGALIPFEASFLRSNLNEEQQRHLMFEASKLIMGCRDALLILNKIFLLTEKEKQAYLANHLSSSVFSSLIREQPQFYAQCQRAYQYRLKPCVELEEGAVDFWLASCPIAFSTLKIYLKTLYSFEGEEWEDVAAEILKRDFYSMPAKLFALATSIIDGKEYGERLSRSRRQNRVLSSMVLLLISIENGKINCSKLTEVGKILYGRSLSSLSEEAKWDRLKEVVCQNYHAPFPPQSSFSEGFRNLVSKNISVQRNLKAKYT